MLYLRLDIRDETYSTALVELVNAQKKQHLAAFWGDGTTTSSDGQNFRGGSAAYGTQHTYLIVYCTTKLIWKLQSITPTLQVLHVFALMHLLGFAFAPSIQDFHDKRLFIHGIS